jgi:hypothetical protein
MPNNFLYVDRYQQLSSLGDWDMRRRFPIEHFSVIIELDRFLPGYSDRRCRPHDDNKAKQSYGYRYHNPHCCREHHYDKIEESQHRTDYWRCSGWDIRPGIPLYGCDILSLET